MLLSAREVVYNANLETSLLAVQKKWNDLLPNATFEYSFMDKTLERLYASEIQLKNAIYSGAFLSLVIVFLGVFGLVSNSLILLHSNIYP